jgi:phage shock protein E
MKTMTIPEFYEATKSLSQKDLILDVRTPMEFAGGHVPHARNIPVDQVMRHVNDLMQFETLYIYCRSGGRADTTWSILDSMGIKNLVCISEGGFPDWQDAGYPVEK